MGHAQEVQRLQRREAREGARERGGAGVADGVAAAQRGRRKWVGASGWVDLEAQVLPRAEVDPHVWDGGPQGHLHVRVPELENGGLTSVRGCLRQNVSARRLGVWGTFIPRTKIEEGTRAQNGA